MALGGTFKAFQLIEKTVGQYKPHRGAYSMRLGSITRYQSVGSTSRNEKKDGTI
jgi:hypothetical protein